MISVYSLVWAILHCSLMAFVLKTLRRNTTFLLKYGTSSLILLTAFCTIRMILPVEFPEHQYIIPDRYLLPLIQGSYEHYLYLLSYLPAIILIWITGTILFITLYLFLYISVQKKILKNAVLAGEPIGEILKDIDPFCPMQVYISPDISVPITAGILHPNIYITEYPYEPEDAYYIILHEYNHWKRKDIWKKVFLYFLSSIMWWNPFSYILRNEFIQILEFKCDSSLCDSLTPQQEMAYLETLYRNEQFLLAHRRTLNTATTTMEFIGSNSKKDAKSTLLQRFALLTYGQEKGHRLAKFLLIVIVCSWMTASYYFLPQPYYMPVLSDDSEMIMFDNISVEESYDNSYNLAFDDDQHGLTTDVSFDHPDHKESEFFQYDSKQDKTFSEYIKKLKHWFSSLFKK